MTTSVPHPPMYEHVIERASPDPCHVLASTLTVATQAQIAEAALLHTLGKCPHTIIRDEAGWMYDVRHCVTCGRGLGLI